MSNDISLKVLMFATTGILLMVIKFLLNKKNNPILNGVFFAILVYYIVIPIISIINIEQLAIYEKSMGKWNNSSIINHFAYESIWQYIYAVFLIIVVMIIMFLIYCKKEKRSNYYLDETKQIKIINFFTMFTFIVGLLSLMVFFLQFGGISKALSYAEYLRSFSNDTTTIIGRYAILVIPARLITVTPFLCYFMIEKTKRKKYRYIFVVSVIASVLFFLFNAGRAPLILFCLPFIYMIIRKKIKHAWILIIIIGVLSLPLLDILDALFKAFRSGELNLVETNYISFLYQFIYPIRNLVNLGPITEQYGFRYGVDFFTSILGLLPGLEFETSYECVSEFFNGYQWKTLGGIPNDYISFGYIEFGIIGVIIISLVIFQLYKRIDAGYREMKESNSKYLFEGVLTVYAYSIMSSFDFVALVKSQFIFIIMCIVILFSIRKERK